MKDKNLMKAFVNNKFGPADVLTLQNVELPIVLENQVLVKTYATSVNTIDIAFRSGTKAMFGLARLSIGILKPKKTILGFDFAGEVVSIGSAVKDFKPGDRVFGGSSSGANAEFMIADENNIAKIPDNINYLEASSIPMAGLSALQALRPYNIHEGHKILIYGASGGIGTFAVQLAKYFGAHVTAVASKKNEQLVRRLGADEFIDYKTEDFTKTGNTYDFIFDTVSKVKNWQKALKEDGIFINAGSPTMSFYTFITAQIGNKFRKRKYKSFDTQYLRQDLEFLAELVENNKIVPVIDKIYSFEELSDAHVFYEQGHTAGKVVVQIVPS